MFEAASAVATQRSEHAACIDRLRVFPPVNVSQEAAAVQCSGLIVKYYAPRCRYPSARPSVCPYLDGHLVFQTSGVNECLSFVRGGQG